MDSLKRRGPHSPFCSMSHLYPALQRAMCVFFTMNYVVKTSAVSKHLSSGTAWEIHPYLCAGHTIKHTHLLGTQWGSSQRSAEGTFPVAWIHNFDRVLWIFMTRNTIGSRYTFGSRKNNFKIDRVALLSNLGLLEWPLIGDTIISVYYWVNGLWFTACHTGRGSPRGAGATNSSSLFTPRFSSGLQDLHFLNRNA